MVLGKHSIGVPDPQLQMSCNAATDHEHGSLVGGVAAWPTASGVCIRTTLRDFRSRYRWKAEVWGGGDRGLSLATVGSGRGVFD